MFYLNQFLQILFKIPARAFLYLVFMGLFIFASAHFSQLESIVVKGIPQDQSNGHFYALISNQENVARVQRDMSKLPGVLRVELLSAQKINAEVQQVVSNFQLDSDSIDLDVSGIKVIFDRSAKEQTKKITAEYLLRLLGEDKVTLGPIKNQEIKKAEVGLMPLIKSWGAILVVALSAFSWLALTLILYSKVKDRAYLISQFQRRTRVAFKIMLVGSITMASIWVALCFILAGVNIVNILLVIALILLSNTLFLGRLKWE